MKRVNHFDLVELGEALFEAQKVEDSAEPFDASITCYDLEKILKRLNHEKFEFGLANHHVAEIISAIDSIGASVREKDKEGNSVKEIGWRRRYNLRRSIENFKTVYAAECKNSATYFVSKVGIYSTNDLIENATLKFSENIRAKIDSATLKEFQNAARCLAYGLHTACAFHMMRAIESILLRLMKVACRKSFPSLNANWGAYLSELEKLASGNGKKKPRKETIDLIRQIKDNHRNPVMHAELELSAQEAMDIFDLGSVVISHLGEEISRLGG